MPEQPLNILFVTADQWRGDCLGYAGHPVVKTPHMDALAAQGTAFMRHYAAAAPCSPARAAMYTGLYQMNNRVVGNGAPLDHRFDNIARAARRQGYVPTLFGYTDISADPKAHDANDPALRTYEGVLPGFEVEQSLLGDQAPWINYLKAQGYPDAVCADPYHQPMREGERIPTGPAPFAAEHSQTAYLTGRLLEWIDMQPTQGWFAHLSLIHPHPPFVASAPYNDMYPPETVGGFQPSSQDALAHPVAQMMRGKRVADYVPGTEGTLQDLSEADLQRIRSVYFGLITEVDAQIGRLVQHLKDTGQWENTLLIMTSDHGELMGDYGLLGKGGFFPESQHIPLIICGPGVEQGQRVKGFTSGVDLFPTLLGLTGGAALNTLDGQDLGPVLRGESGDTGHEMAVWEYDYRDQGDLAYGRAHADCHMQICMDETHLLVASPSDAPLLFDIGNAGHCGQDLGQEPRAQEHRLRLSEALLRFRLRHNDQSLARVRLGADGARILPEG
jgi:arylsulfatase A-like enzyme